jgi:hypothetical protein
MFSKFSEYLNGRGKLVEKPKVKQIADDLEAEPNKPPKEKRGIKSGKQAQIKEGNQMKVVERPPTELVPKGPKPTTTPPAPVTKGKNWDTKAPKTNEKPKPYAAPAASGKAIKGESGLADKGDTKYEPDVKPGNSPYIPGGKNDKGWETKTEQFLTKTRGMSMSEFAQFMKEDFDIDAPLVIMDLVNRSKTSPRIIDALIHEMKRQGLLPQMLEAISTHAEFKQWLEAVGPPFGMDDEDEEFPDDEEDLEDEEDLDDGDELDSEVEDEEDLEGDEEDELGDELDDEEDLEGDELEGEFDDEEAPGDGFGEDQPDENVPPALSRFRSRLGQLGSGGMGM